jgi:tetratricopeptide (TPR) repeat protein
MWKPLRRFHVAMPRGVLTGLLLFTALQGTLWSSSKRLEQRQIEGLLQGGVASRRIASIVLVRGIAFKPTPSILRSLERKGAQPVLLDSLRKAEKRQTLTEARRQPSPAPLAPSLSPDAVHYAEQYGAAQHHFERGKQFFQQEQWLDTETEMQKAVVLDPLNIEAHFDLGFALSQEGKVQGAIAEYRRVLELDPDAGAVHYDLGVAFQRQENLKAAIQEYRYAIRLNPDDKTAVYALGVARYDQGDWSGAEEEFRKVLVLAPGNADAHCALGLAQLHQHLVDEAIPELYEAVRLKPQDALAHAGLAGALLRKGNRQGALKEFQVALALNPANSGYRADFQKLWRQLYPHDANPAINP